MSLGVYGWMSVRVVCWAIHQVLSASAQESSLCLWSEKLASSFNASLPSTLFLYFISESLSGDGDCTVEVFVH